jgi:hypothetical protein
MLNALVDQIAVALHHSDLRLLGLNMAASWNWRTGTNVGSELFKALDSVCYVAANRFRRVRRCCSELSTCDSQVPRATCINAE